MSRPSCIEDAIAEQLKDVCNHKATFIVHFNYGSITVEEVLEPVELKPKKLPSLFEGENDTV